MSGASQTYAEAATTISLSNRPLITGSSGQVGIRIDINGIISSWINSAIAVSYTPDWWGRLYPAAGFPNELPGWGLQFRLSVAGSPVNIGSGLTGIWNLVATGASYVFAYTVSPANGTWTLEFRSSTSLQVLATAVYTVSRT